ncbi:hypothetical protein NWFMUON74_64230 [Nocardia wallacei]|uniref:Uncharacterized protein n=1 Tax=Nocardia wallacei TaxID=480035 RepID=A0A7G1KUQ2_9NOCA|nr:hypothetical protein NWFMUON74_64230 [Nocardia wallacei]
MVAVLNRRNALTVDGGNASPPTKTTRSDRHSSVEALEANTGSSDGTNEVCVTRCRPMTSERYIGSRWPSGTATITLAPTARVANSSHSEASKVNGVLCSATLVSSRPNSAIFQAIWFAIAACDTATPFGRPVDPEVYST